MRAGVCRTETFGPKKRRGAAENVMTRSMFPEKSTEETEGSKNGKGFKGPGGEHIKNCG